MDNFRTALKLCESMEFQSCSEAVHGIYRVIDEIGLLTKCGVDLIFTEYWHRGYMLTPARCMPNAMEHQPLPLKGSVPQDPVSSGMNQTRSVQNYSRNESTNKYDNTIRMS